MLKYMYDAPAMVKASGKESLNMAQPEAVAVNI
jgi:hypothetical protein